MITSLQAAILGLIEGLTEFLPISSTGHLILASEWLGLEGEAVKAFEIIIQAGALLAVLGLYYRKIHRRLLVDLLISFLPAAVVGLFFHEWIKANLFNRTAVTLALLIGGIFMIWVDRILPKKNGSGSLFSITYSQAWVIGLAQLFSLWPGTSRSMVTIVAAMLLGFPAAVAAEYSFLLALPTLGGAALFDLTKSSPVLFHEITPTAFFIGFSTAAITATLVMKAFVRYLTKAGLTPFGIYRIALALLVWKFMP